MTRAYPYVESIDCEPCEGTGWRNTHLNGAGALRGDICEACGGFGSTAADGKPLTFEEARAALCADEDP